MKRSRERLKVEFLEEAEELFDELMAWDENTPEPNLTQIEDIILALRKRMGERMAQAVINRQEMRRPSEKIHCPECEKEVDSKGPKGSQVETRVGGMQIERSYYYCPRCQQGFFPSGSTTDVVGETME
ncbi:MAG: hypothetical protein HN855_01605 [Anaerolineae bacterium]|nr:hypothetical protein [Anaerolineae bacterium]